MPLGPHLILIISRKTAIYRKNFTPPCALIFYRRTPLVSVLIFLRTTLIRLPIFSLSTADFSSTETNMPPFPIFNKSPHFARCALFCANQVYRWMPSASGCSRVPPCSGLTGMRRNGTGLKRRYRRPCLRSVTPFKREGEIIHWPLKIHYSGRGRESQGTLFCLQLAKRLCLLR